MDGNKSIPEDSREIITHLVDVTNAYNIAVNKFLEATNNNFELLPYTTSEIILKPLLVELPQPLRLGGPPPLRLGGRKKHRTRHNKKQRKQRKYRRTRKY